jgi:hypothetical protein
MSCVTEITPLHEVPGRVRYFVPQIKSSLVNAESLREHLIKAPGVYHVKTNPQLGTMIVYFDGGVLTKDGLHDHIHACRLVENKDVDTRIPPSLNFKHRAVAGRGASRRSESKSGLLMEVVKHGLLVAGGSSSSGLGLGLTALRTLLSVTSRAH